ncbi:Uncharacterised protein [Mycobacterium tuberculosis]|uniref:Uncharacterized protein n=1 Tax=Mycobacterium tuberculosis TaxID=1773 RepID=A0A655JQZ4_MYCTX|nr:Uncharacterised protein [Mycobacterium tuberculosis]CFS29527.1 Uncharacterised protein [Mycobacterium tuberculosis]COW62987.1 Uncharacterised protein [Mycobacterium tuberculosis]COX30286.1 Uncharacterised protein [Mycobacterium tuberculosis]COX40916.1 Uncharacterised protein [Mycobacterium tuberculosis]
MQLQIRQPVLVFQILLMVQCRSTDIDRHYFRRTIGECENRRLVGSATGDQNIQIGPVFAVRP